MESTGKYWVPIWNDLEAASINVITAIPSGFPPSREIRTPRKIPIGSVTCSAWGWFPEATSPSRISVSSVSSPPLSEKARVHAF